MDLLAQRLGSLLLRSGRRTFAERRRAFGETIQSIGVGKCLDMVARSMEIDKLRGPGRSYKRGRSGHRRKQTRTRTAEAEVIIFADGTLEVRYMLMNTGWVPKRSWLRLLRRIPGYLDKLESFGYTAITLTRKVRLQLYHIQYGNAMRRASRMPSAAS